MNELVIQLCNRIQAEAQSVKDSMTSNGAIIKSGHEKSVETVALLENMAMDNVEHLQKLVLSLVGCFFQSKDNKEANEE